MFEEKKLFQKLGNRALIYGLIKSIPQFILLSYILAELFMRFAYDSCYVHFIKKKVDKPESPLTPSTEFNMPPPVPSPRRKLNRKYFYSKYGSKATHLLNKIYHWDKDFRYTTIATCTYIIAFVLLYYLTCMFTFQSLMGTSSISFHIRCMEFIFEIGKTCIADLIQSIE